MSVYVVVHNRKQKKTNLNIKRDSPLLKKLNEWNRRITRRDEEMKKKLKRNKKSMCRNSDVVVVFISGFYDCFRIFFFIHVDFVRNLCDCANHFDGGHLLFAVLTAPIFTQQIKKNHINF